MRDSWGSICDFDNEPEYPVDGEVGGRVYGMVNEVNAQADAPAPAPRKTSSAAIDPVRTFRVNDGELTYMYSGVSSGFSR